DSERNSHKCRSWGSDIGSNTRDGQLHPAQPLLLLRWERRMESGFRVGPRRLISESRCLVRACSNPHHQLQRRSSLDTADALDTHGAQGYFAALRLLLRVEWWCIR